jgi:hypothetical protein
MRIEREVALMMFSCRGEADSTLYVVDVVLADAAAKASCVSSWSLAFGADRHHHTAIELVDRMVIERRDVGLSPTEPAHALQGYCHHRRRAGRLEHGSHAGPRRDRQRAD